ncbi:hypothetical protein [Sphingomonas glaciei]|uniref:Glycosyltransferase RgtA/B/C/D-like domain-containing protein n=1 Tax=Sphingomonas glaciei TaxID=2938948 RepID=A0ABY5MZS5_9SPHN|nr:hypothetical protein [Sphingomonas glaciei]UUR08807.1 hypothetical protein M1K48_04005 [Sphingomonas glaciei]
MSFMSPIVAANPAKRGLRTRETLLVLGLFALVAALRLPLSWIEGRFQDEEATVFLAYAWHFPAEALLRSFGGYLNIAANGITLALAGLIRGGAISLEKAPYITMLAGLASQLVPAILVLRSRSPWLEDSRHRAVALAVLLLMPTTEEVFLNVMHIQFHLALAVGLIVTLQAGSGRRRAWFEGAVLFLAPLCGPAAIVFLPLFALRAVVDRDSRRWRQFAILATGAAIQLLSFYHSTPLRGAPFDPVNLAAAMFIRLIALPFGGLNGADHVGFAAAVGLVQGGPGLYLIAALSVGVFSTLFVTTLKSRDDAFWLFAAAMSVAAVSLGFGILTGAPYAAFFSLAGPRYNYIPLVLLGLCFLCLATRANEVERRAPRLLLGLMLFVGAVHFVQPIDIYAGGPSWKREVAAWRADPNHQLEVWPFYHADLSDRHVRCDGPFAQGQVSPRYCEQGWLRSFDSWKDSKTKPAP